MCILWLMIRGQGTVQASRTSSCVMNNYKFIVAANRDEFNSRPTEPAHFWPENPHILAGRDLLEGGTWMGITKTGKFSIVTNISMAPRQTTSRGALVSNFLIGQLSSEQYMENLSREKERYTGFNLITMQIESDGRINAVYFNNHKMSSGKTLANGIYGLSNCEMDTPWVKLEKGRACFEDVLHSSEDLSTTELTDRLIDILQDRTRHDDPLMADVTKDYGEELTSVFVDRHMYGTQSSSVILVDTSNNVTFTEYSSSGEPRQNGTDRAGAPWTKKIFKFTI